MLHIFTAINSYISSMLDNKDTPPVSLSLEGMMAIFTKLQKEELPKNTILVKPGHICQHIYFIEKGAARIFYYKEEKILLTASEERKLYCYPLSALSAKNRINEE